ncbi:MAG: universal stress protein [Gemmatimonadaceae bacterium]|nr:universal stress protein [Gemmatimonadaceae bacterium]
MGASLPGDDPKLTPSSDFLTLVRQRERGKLKLYIGSAAGVGKTYRMLAEAHQLRARDVDVVIGFIETHGREETAAQVGDLEVIPRRRIEYRHVWLEEMDGDAIVTRNPEVAIVDELAHTNVPGSPRAKRWEDVIWLLDNGISVISAVNVQHLESLNDIVAETLGVIVRETLPDWVLGLADQVVNLDISAEDLRQRLIEGKIYAREKVPAALANFFTPENLSTLRELALREVASSVDRSREETARRERGAAGAKRTVDRLLVAMSSNPPYTAALLRRASRIAGRLNTDWYCVYVQTPEESADRIDATIQRKLVENIQLAQTMGAEIVQLRGADVAATLLEFARARGVTLILTGQSRRSRWQHFVRKSVVDRLISNALGIDVLVVSFTGPESGS